MLRVGNELITRTQQSTQCYHPVLTENREKTHLSLLLHVNAVIIDNWFKGNPKAQNPKSEPGSESWYLDSGKVDEKLETRILGYRVPGYGVPVLLENTRWYKDVLDVNLGLSCLSARGWYTKANCYGYVLIDWAEGQTGKYLAQAEVRTQRQMVWPNLTPSGNISILSYNQFCSTYICAFACRTVQQKIKIRSQNVHFHFSWKKKNNCRN